MANWSTQTALRECKLEENGELTVVERLANLLETGKYADVTITVGGGDDTVTFKAHRLLLASASQPLCQLMTENQIKEDSTIRVPDVDPEAFQHVLKYIYTDDLEISSTGESLVLLKLSQNWGLKSLFQKTIKFLDDFLNEYEPISENSKNEICELLVLCEKLAPDLESKCWSTLLKYVNDIVPCQGFLNMPRELVKKMFSHPDFQYKNHLVLFEAIRDWGMNQILERNLNVNDLQELIGEFLKHVDFKAIRDLDFIDTIVPSELLGKADIIAFFMARGLEIPRDLSFNNNNRSDTSLPYEKTCRYKRGFKLSTQEVYKEHELRFRVDKSLRLLGVGFGFLFSNTDMGITVHCQGPWETRQWRDIIQTYCRVSWEKMKTADVRLMFSEPVKIEANQCYKILVRISRMSSGTSDVELWGGTEGNAKLNTNDAEFCFLKSAVDSDKTVEDSATENKPGMITDLFYELINPESEADKGIKSMTGTRNETTGQNREICNGNEEYRTPSRVADNNLDLYSRTNSSSLNSSSTIENIKSNNDRSIGYSYDKYKAQQNSKNINNNENELSSTRNYRYNKSDYSSRLKDYSKSSLENKDTESSFRRPLEEDSLSTSRSNRWQKKSQAEEAASYYLPQKPSALKNTNALPSFLQSKRISSDSSTPSWLLPSRNKTTTSSVLDRYSKRDSISSIDQTPRRSSKVLENYPNLKYSPAISHYKSKFDSSTSNSKYSDYEPYSKQPSKDDSKSLTSRDTDSRLNKWKYDLSSKSKDNTDNGTTSYTSRFKSSDINQPKSSLSNYSFRDSSRYPSVNKYEQKDKSQLTNSSTKQDDSVKSYGKTSDFSSRISHTPYRSTTNTGKYEDNIGETSRYKSKYDTRNNSGSLSNIRTTPNRVSSGITSKYGSNYNTNNTNTSSYSADNYRATPSEVSSRVTAATNRVSNSRDLGDKSGATSRYGISSRDDNSTVSSRYGTSFDKSNISSRNRYTPSKETYDRDYSSLYKSKPSLSTSSAGQKLNNDSCDPSQSKKYESRFKTSESYSKPTSSISTYRSGTPSRYNSSPKDATPSRALSRASTLRNSSDKVTTDEISTPTASRISSNYTRPTIGTTSLPSTSSSRYSSAYSRQPSSDTGSRFSGISRRFDRSAYER